MSDIQEKEVSPLPVLYVALYPLMRKRARKLGYALAVHGSLVRDCDLIAVPWVENAVEPYELAKALSEITHSEISLDAPMIKPFGRIAYTFQIGGAGGYVDLSIVGK